MMLLCKARWLRETPPVLRIAVKSTLHTAAKTALDTWEGADAAILHCLSLKEIGGARVQGVCESISAHN